MAAFTFSLAKLLAYVNVSDQGGRVLQDVYNREGNDRYKYYYSDPQHSALH